MNIISIMGLIFLAFIFLTSLVLGLMCLIGKNIILDDVYLKATKEEQKKMDVKIFRIQSATTFILVSVMTLFNLLRWFTQNPLFSYAALGVFVVTLAYFVASHFVLKKKFRQSNR